MQNTNNTAMTIDLAVIRALTCYRLDIDNDINFSRWLYGQAFIPYEIHPRIGLDQRQRMMKRVMRYASLDSLKENDFSPSLVRVATNFFDENPELFNDAVNYFSV